MSARLRFQSRLSRLLNLTAGLAAGCLIGLSPVLASTERSAPIPDTVWKQEVSSEQAVGSYDITRGDTPFDVSKRLFGDPRFLFKNAIKTETGKFDVKDLHPGKRIAFTPGTGTTLPVIAIEASNNGAGSLTAADIWNAPLVLPPRKRRPSEWKRLPAQNWESSRIEEEEAAKQELKVMGKIDKVNTIAPTRELPAFASSRLLDPFGRIKSSASQLTYFRVGDQVLVENDKNIKDGESYALVSPADRLEKNDRNRQGFVYRVLGEIEITGRQGNLWLATITQVRGFIDRGTELAPRLARIPLLDPIAAPAAIEGTFYLDRQYSAYLTAQNGFGFVNLGSEDGLQEGMILESFLPKDPYSGTPFKKKTLFHATHLQVVQISERFSTVRVVAGIGEIEAGTPVRLLTDIGKFKKFGAFLEPEEASQTETIPEGQASDPQNIPAPESETPAETPVDPSIPAPEATPEPGVTQLPVTDLDKAPDFSNEPSAEAPTPAPSAESQPPTAPAPEEPPPPAPADSAPAPAPAAPAKAPPTAPATVPTPMPEDPPPPTAPAPASVPDPGAGSLPPSRGQMSP